VDLKDTDAPLTSAALTPHYYIAVLLDEAFFVPKFFYVATAGDF
jgi:hypothetical protein